MHESSEDNVGSSVSTPLVSPQKSSKQRTPGEGGKEKENKSAKKDLSSRERHPHPAPAAGGGSAGTPVPAGTAGFSAANAPAGCVRWFFVGLSCFAMFFTVLNLSLHDMISEHGHGTPEAPSKLSNVRNFVINEVAAEQKFVKDEVIWVGNLLAKEYTLLRSSGLERAGMARSCMSDVCVCDGLWGVCL